MPTQSLTIAPLTVLVVILSFSGWITSAYLYIETTKQTQYMAEAKLINAYNILSGALGSASSESELHNIINDWRVKGWSAQTGSLTTICDNNAALLVNLNPVIDEPVSEHICQTNEQYMHRLKK
ncbi:Uncharacterised protein [Vibrio owensii]|uniref:hypothetical protein n=1 Tax=Vibrio owensii TaxID=696485 RepID=UPI00057650DA|nr:hypothetical protein [Vibrio owensii]SUP42530.1 Uncharacterised protein [Vibrio owensii]